tara:strand:- start:2170 stop:2412 length:243 start_codon:yes stop_codon:yes gene_type:complete
MGAGGRPAVRGSQSVCADVVQCAGQPHARAQQAAGVRAEFHRYHGAGHGFQDFTNDERFRAPQSEHARQEPLALLGDRLG